MMKKALRALVTGAFTSVATIAGAQQEVSRALDLPTPHIEGSAFINACMQSDLALTMYISGLTTHFFTTEFSNYSSADLDRVALNYIDEGVMQERDWYGMLWTYATPEEKATALSVFTARNLFQNTISQETNGAINVLEMREYCGPQVPVQQPRIPGR